MSGIENNEFEVYYQPIINTKDSKILLAEALVRWISPTLGFVRPDIFIPLLEQNGFISKLDYYVREKVCQYFRNKIDFGMVVRPISVNISKVELENPTFINDLIAQVDSYSIPRELLRLEITESSIMNNFDLFNSLLTKLKNEGFYLEMDDFGSGYSSLAAFSDFTFDLIKLDMRFFMGKEIIKKQSIVKHLANLAKEVGIEVIAEGVETKQQVDFLDGIGINQIQGYYYSKPLPQVELIKFIKKHC